jgi:hypothetical protein
MHTEGERQGMEPEREKALVEAVRFLLRYVQSESQQVEEFFRKGLPASHYKPTDHDETADQVARQAAYCQELLDRL